VWAFLPLEKRGRMQEPPGAERCHIGRHPNGKLIEAGRTTATAKPKKTIANDLDAIR